MSVNKGSCNAGLGLLAIGCGVLSRPCEFDMASRESLADKSLLSGVDEPEGCLKMRCSSSFMLDHEPFRLEELTGGLKELFKRFFGVVLGDEE